MAAGRPSVKHGRPSTGSSFDESESDMPLSRLSDCKKRRFRDKREAVSALHQAANARSYCARTGTETRRREVRSYSCDRCRGYHLTSQA